MNTFSKKVLKLVAIIEAALLFISLIIFQNFGMFMYFLLLAALFLGGIALLLWLMGWLSKE